VFFQEILNLLRDNKRFPNYAAERRIDIFINLFLEKILSAYYGEKVIFVVPEFPLKKNETNNQTDKLDYLCAFEETKQPIFVELKTDVISFNINQAKFYCDQAKHWPTCVEALQKIIVTRMPFSYRKKYFQLIKRLLEMGIFVGKSTEPSLTRLEELSKSIDTTSEGRGELHQGMKKANFSRGLIKLVECIKARWNNEAKLLYLTPHDDKLKNRIELLFSKSISLLDFKEIASFPVISTNKYAKEFRQLSEFLKSLE